jgi:hypothetical protein
MVGGFSTTLHGVLQNQLDKEASSFRSFRLWGTWDLHRRAVKCGMKYMLLFGCNKLVLI